ncbi:hypothetical protein HY389_01160 [Candidatus Daviesbacteria bacterium]|nr:hypothetical protein [Candidatus Daviesbacteria bacterium]
MPIETRASFSIIRKVWPFGNTEREARDPLARLPQDLVEAACSSSSYDEFDTNLHKIHQKLNELGQPPINYGEEDYLYDFWSTNHPDQTLK